jgi:hypothetical protein
MQSSLNRGLTLLLAITVTGISVVHAAPSATSAYSIDPQTSYVQDATSDSIGQVNMISCIMHSTLPNPAQAAPAPTRARRRRLST